MENLENYMFDLQEELVDTIAIVTDMKPMTQEQELQQLKQLCLIERLIRGLNA